MKFKRYDLTNAADGWPCNVLRLDRQIDGERARTWSSNGQQLVLSDDGHSLILPGTKTLFVLPGDDD